MLRPSWIQTGERVVEFWATDWILSDFFLFIDGRTDRQTELGLSEKLPAYPPRLGPIGVTWLFIICSFSSTYGRGGLYCLFAMKYLLFCCLKLKHPEKRRTSRRGSENHYTVSIFFFSIYFESSVTFIYQKTLQIPFQISQFYLPNCSKDESFFLLRCRLKFMFSFILSLLERSEQFWALLRC